VRPRETELSDLFQVRNRFIGDSTTQPTPRLKSRKMFARVRDEILQSLRLFLMT
jgi:hypothetical protein